MSNVIKEFVVIALRDFIVILLFSSIVIDEGLVIEPPFNCIESLMPLATFFLTIKFLETSNTESI